jgi:hypothetical protein
MRLTALLAGLGFACLACSGDDSKLEQASLNIEASDQSGRYGQITCQTLPFLQGSRSYQRYVVDDLITLVVTAEPGQISVQFQSDGLSVAKALTIPRSKLLHGFAQEVPLLLQGGARYSIQLSSECPP